MLWAVASHKWYNKQMSFCFKPFCYVRADFLLFYFYFTLWNVSPFVLLSSPLEDLNIFEFPLTREFTRILHVAYESIHKLLYFIGFQRCLPPPSTNQNFYTAYGTKVNFYHFNLESLFYITLFHLFHHPLIFWTIPKNSSANLQTNHNMIGRVRIDGYNVVPDIYGCLLNVESPKQPI